MSQMPWPECVCVVRCKYDMDMIPINLSYYFYDSKTNV